MIFHRKLALIVAGLAIATPQLALGAPAPDAKAWNGTWHLNTAKSKFSSPEYSATSETRSYNVSGNKVALKSTIKTHAGKTINWNYSAALDGKWYPMNGNPNGDSISLTPVGPREAKAEVKLKGKPAVTSTSTVSADGKHLTVHRQMLLAKGGPTDDLLIYDRAK
jgi:hypothetical protein